METASGDSVPEVTTIVHGIIMGVEMPFPLSNPNACIDSGIVCPLEKDKIYAYKQTLPVLKSYPKVCGHSFSVFILKTTFFQKKL